MQDLAILTILLYAGLMTYWRLHLGRLDRTQKESQPTKFSIIIAYRNEADQMMKLCQSLIELEHPAYEVILVDDHSTDDGPNIASSFLSQMRLKLLKNAGEGKKSALDTGIRQASNPQILLSDADCELPPHLLNTVSAYTHAQEILLGPVRLIGRAYHFLDYFQIVDFAMMQMATALSAASGKIFLANGANISYPQKVYLASGGFRDTDTPSGDDILFVQQLDLPSRYIFDQNAIVTTPVQPDLKSFISQRIRWASKTSKYTSTFAQMTSLLFLITNFVSVLLLIYMLMGSISWIYFVGFLLLKFASELMLLLPSMKFFSIPIRPFSLLVMQPLHILYMCIVGVLSFFKKYEWKGRKY